MQGTIVINTDGTCTVSMGGQTFAGTVRLSEERVEGVRKAYVFTGAQLTVMEPTNETEAPVAKAESLGEVLTEALEAAEKPTE